MANPNRCSYGSGASRPSSIGLIDELLTKSERGQASRRAIDAILQIPQQTSEPRRRAPRRRCLEGASAASAAETGAGSSTQTVLPFTDHKFPHGVAVDSTGNLYVADTGNNRVLDCGRGDAPHSGRMRRCSSRRGVDLTVPARNPAVSGVGRAG